MGRIESDPEKFNKDFVLDVDLEEVEAN